MPETSTVATATAPPIEAIPTLAPTLRISVFLNFSERTEHGGGDGSGVVWVVGVGNEEIIRSALAKVLFDHPPTPMPKLSQQFDNATAAAANEPVMFSASAFWS